MAETDGQTAIINAIQSLSNTLQAKYINFFDKSTLTDLRLPPGQKRYLIPTGSIALNAWRHGDDVHLVCMSEDSPELHTSLVAERLQLHPDTKLPANDILELSSPTLSRSVKGGRGNLSTFVDLKRNDKAGCKFYLHYCAIPNGYDPSTMNSIRIPAYPPTTHSLAVERHLNMVRDVQYLALETIWSFKFDDFGTTTYFDSFKLAYRNLRGWTEEYGLFGPRIGFLDSQTLMWLVHCAYVERFSSLSDATARIEGGPLMRNVFNQFRAILDPKSCPDSAAVLSIKVPSKTAIGKSWTPELKQAIAAAIVRTETSTVEQVIDRKPRNGFRDFLEDMEYFYKVDSECFDTSPTKLAAFEDAIVPKNLNKALDIIYPNIRIIQFGGLTTRLWPNTLRGPDHETRIVYAIGFKRSRWEACDEEPIQGVLASMSRAITQQHLDYDTTAALITVSMATKGDFEQFISPEAGNIENTRDTMERPPRTMTPQTSVHSDKFRDAHSAISRLRYDPQHSGIEYEVGYLDRFQEELLWMPLELWGGKQTEDLDFVPEHRIRQLRRMDGIVVWDREKRLDLTGISA